MVVAFGFVGLSHCGHEAKALDERSARPPCPVPCSVGCDWGGYAPDEGCPFSGGTVHVDGGHT